MAYTRQTWVNGRSGNTPVSAPRLNAMETGIYNAAAVADSANSKATTNTSKISTINTSLSNITSDISALDGRVSDLEQAGGGGAGLSVCQFVNNGEMTIANNAWQLSQAMADYPGATQSGDITVVTSAAQFWQVNTTGLYMYAMTLIDKANPSGQGNNLNDLQLMTAVNGSVTATKARFQFYASNQGSGMATVSLTAGQILRLAHRQNATGGSFTCPDGVAAVANNTEIGCYVAFLRVG